jgi:hypothetical protein
MAKIPFVQSDIKGMFRKKGYAGWPFAILMGLILGVLVLVDKGAVTTSSLTAACRMQVTADLLSERGSADPAASSEKDLHRGDVVGATTEMQNGYRRLADGNWALDTYLNPLPGSKCGTG